MRLLTITKTLKTTMGEISLVDQWNSLADSLVFIPLLFATHHENKENFGLQSTLVKPWCPFVFLYLLTAKLKLYPHLSQRHGRVELRFGLFMYAREGNGCIFGKFCSRNFVSSGRHMFSKPNLAVTL